MIEQLHQHLTSIAGIFASLAALLAAAIGFRKQASNILSVIGKLITAPIRLEKQIAILIEKGDARETELKKINYALFNGGQEGLCQQVARLSACHSANFESAPYPSFEYTSGGTTTRVNDAYRILTGAWTQSIIGAGRWQQAIHGELMNDYIDEQHRCADAKEDFIGVCDFKNPMTDKHRGRWRVHAPAAQIGDDCLYVGRFVAALDDVAREIAMEHGWNVKLR